MCAAPKKCTKINFSTSCKGRDQSLCPFYILFIFSGPRKKSPEKWNDSSNGCLPAHLFWFEESFLLFNIQSIWSFLSSSLESSFFTALFANNKSLEEIEFALAVNWSCNFLKTASLCPWFVWFIFLHFFFDPCIIFIWSSCRFGLCCICPDYLPSGWALNEGKRIFHLNFMFGSNWILAYTFDLLHSASLFSADQLRFPFLAFGFLLQFQENLFCVFRRNLFCFFTQTF